MNFQRFIDGYQSLYNGFGTSDVKPLVPLLSRITADYMTTDCKARLINFAVSCMDADEIYLEAGIWRGGLLIAALLDNKATAIGVDNWSEFQSNPLSSSEGRARVLTNLTNHSMMSRVTIIDSDIVSAFRTMRFPRIGVYNYDAHHGYQQTIDGVVSSFSHLHNGSLIFVDDVMTWGGPKDAVDFLLKEYGTGGGYRLSRIAELNGDSHDGKWATGVCVLLCESGFKP